MSTTLFGFPPMFDLPSPSPFVMKADMQLQMLGVTFDRARAEVETVPKRKAPYVRDHGRLIEDSTFIRKHFEKKLGADLDAGLSQEQRAFAWALERMLEDRLHFINMMERWLVDANFYKGPYAFFQSIPAEAREGACVSVRDSMRTAMRRLGLGRHSFEERMELAARDINAVSAALGDKDYIFCDTCMAVDAAAFGVLSSCGTPFFDTPLVDFVERRDNLRPFLGRVQERFFNHALAA
jgi:glutathione S-transferase